MKKEETNRKVYVVGHKNPDTDSICSAIVYASLKTKLTGIEHTPRRAGQLNEETQYVLERFGVKTPALLSDLRVQIKDVELREVDGVPGSVSIKTAWAKMKDLNIKTLPVTRNGRLVDLSRLVISRPPIWMYMTVLSSPRRGHSTEILPAR